jgi:hypothetical protein
LKAGSLADEDDVAVGVAARKGRLGAALVQSALGAAADLLLEDGEPTPALGRIVILGGRPRSLRRNWRRSRLSLILPWSLRRSLRCPTLPLTLPLSLLLSPTPILSPTPFLSPTPSLRRPPPLSRDRRQQLRRIPRDVRFVEPAVAQPRDPGAGVLDELSQLLPQVARAVAHARLARCQ